MPDYRWEISFFVMFRGRAMGLRRKFVLLGGFPVRLVHGLSSCGSYWQLSFSSARSGPIARKAGMRAWLLTTASLGGANPL
jgi:hypothetical protein